MRVSVFLLFRKAFTACFYHPEERRSSDGGACPSQRNPQLR